MQQLAFRFDPAPPPAIVEALQWFRTDLDKKGWSYGRIGVMRNVDGTWSYTTSDNFGGYCGHGGPFHGSYPSFDEALGTAIARLYCGWKKISERTTDSCCKDNHRAMARKGMQWLESLEAEYGVAH
ncbi:hypothetical protein [Sinorhizobium sp. 22678]|uniref:hypothetical protein n=1 Tax=Sinorhizobium sp. 22678 TaxID=3453955 RepID=UPI003F8546AC